tara:strand:- start:315 stop:452 length:138 start_codon:yes stop_codon:yes gene_type:complete
MKITKEQLTQIINEEVAALKENKKITISQLQKIVQEEIVKLNEEK